MAVGDKPLCNPMSITKAVLLSVPNCSFPFDFKVREGLAIDIGSQEKLVRELIYKRASTTCEFWIFHSGRTLIYNYA